MEISTFGISFDTMDNEQKKAAALQIISLVRPNWIHNEIYFESFNTAPHNIYYATGTVFAASFHHEKLIFRVFAETSHLVINRHHELRNWMILRENNLAAPIIAKFKNGVVCGSLNGTSLTTELLRNDTYSKSIAQQLAKFHSTIKVDSNATPEILNKLHHLLSQIQPYFKDPRQLQFFRYKFRKSLAKDIQEIEKCLEFSNFKVGFCHNNLAAQNILIDEDENVQFINYEYCGVNYILYDFADYFNAYGGVDKNTDYYYCPDKNQKRYFCYEYLKYTSANVVEYDVFLMTQTIPLFEAMSHLHWCLWGIVQAQNVESDFNYLEYAHRRYLDYERRMAKYRGRFSSTNL